MALCMLSIERIALNNITNICAGVVVLLKLKSWKYINPNVENVMTTMAIIIKSF